MSKDDLLFCFGSSSSEGSKYKKNLKKGLQHPEKKQCLLKNKFRFRSLNLPFWSGEVVLRFDFRASPLQATATSQYPLKGWISWHMNYYSQYLKNCIRKRSALRFYFRYTKKKKKDVREK